MLEALPNLHFRRDEEVQEAMKIEQLPEYNVMKTRWQSIQSEKNVIDLIALNFLLYFITDK
jgi:hypothetical protein